MNEFFSLGGQVLYCNSDRTHYTLNLADGTVTLLHRGSDDGWRSGGGFRMALVWRDGKQVVGVDEAGILLDLLDKGPHRAHSIAAHATAGGRRTSRGQMSPPRSKRMAGGSISITTACMKSIRPAERSLPAGPSYPAYNSRRPKMSAIGVPIPSVKPPRRLLYGHVLLGVRAGRPPEMDRGVLVVRKDP